MQTVATPYALIDTSTGGIVARYTFDNSTEWWAWYSDYLKTPQWQRRAERCKQRAGYKCERCGAAGVTLHAHHLSYKRVGKERESDLLAVCVDCHADIHQKQI